MSKIRLYLRKVAAGAACLAGKKSLRNVVVVTICLAGVTVFTSCDSDNVESKNKNLQYVQTELGGCNRNSTLKSGDSETEEDKVVISVFEESVHVFVGRNYICCAPFETKCETIDDVIIMTIIDTCENKDCYCRCMCYYTFDFIFTHQGKFNQKYKVLLIDPREEKPLIISEGIITENK